MGIQRDRLLALVEFAQQTARLRISPAITVAEHGLFALHEYRIRGLPGIRLNVNDAEDEVWFAVKRLHETKPPEVKADEFRPWVQMTSNPNEEPRLRPAVDRADLSGADTPRFSESSPKQDRASADVRGTITLLEYESVEQVRAEFATYIEAEWRPWAEEEKARRETIRLYAQLFTLKQQLDGGMTPSPLEIVWGVGVGIWHSGGTTVGYPLITRAVEVSLNAATTELEIRPRDVDARLETDWYASVDNPGVATLETAAKSFWGNATTTFSPFDPGTFEPLLRAAVANLDGNGIYWPNEVPATERALPKPDDKLKVTDTWVLFARPRTNSLFVEDLEQLKKRAEETDFYPPAITAVVSDPETTNTAVELPIFRGLSVSCPGENPRETPARDLYFPKPFNEEQVRIIQLLDIFDGVVVQGPPGTGKTHTIANVICHYLAEGKRVLVTSMKDPATVDREPLITNIEAETSAAAWIKCVQTFLESRTTSRFNLVVGIGNPVALSPSDEAVCRTVDSFLRSKTLQPLITVANTIFPGGFYRDGGAQAVYDEFPKSYEETKSGWGTYAGRIFADKIPLTNGKCSRMERLVPESGVKVVPEMCLEALLTVV